MRKAMILAAGLGTRLRPLTDHTPKALIEVGGKPMLERVIDRLEQFGFGDIVINVHYLGDQIMDYVRNGDFKARIRISDERGELLDTGGGVAATLGYFDYDETPVLIHNVDILSNSNLDRLYLSHLEQENDVTLLTSGRDSSRKLIFNTDNCLAGWHNLNTDEYRPAGFCMHPGDEEEAFSGIYVVGMDTVRKMWECGKGKPFPVMDFLLGNVSDMKIGRIYDPDLRLIDIGKPATLSQANSLFEI